MQGSKKYTKLFDSWDLSATNYKIFVKALMSEMTPVDCHPVLGNPTEMSSYLKPFVGLREVGEILYGKDFWRDEQIVPYDLKYREPSEQCPYLINLRISFLPYRVI